MIFYFSATGNCKYVAIRLASSKDEKLVAIAEAMKKGEFTYAVPKGERVGIIVPTYNWALPSIVNEFLEKLEFKFEEKTYLYFIATYGTNTGRTGLYANRYLEKKGLFFDAYYSVKMPDTWTPVFNLSNQEKMARINDKAESSIDEIREQVLDNTIGDFMRAKLPKFAVKWHYPMYEKMRMTKKLHVEDSCIGCGICEKKCPVAAIEVKNGKPVWVKDQCVMCLGCLHRCPKFAIQYGKATKKHGQYINPHVKI